MIRKRPGDPVLEKIVIKESGYSPIICSELRRQMVTRKGLAAPTKIVIQRKQLDALLVGTLQDIIGLQNHWELVELNASSKLSLHLLDVLSRRKRVRTLIVKDPCQPVLEFLAGWFGNQHLTYASLDHVAIRSATILSKTAEALGEGLGNDLCRITHLELSDVSFPSLVVVHSIANGLAKHQRLEKLSLKSCHLDDSELTILLRALQHHDNLKELCLSMNYCQQEGTSSLEQILTSSTASLQKLDVSCQDTWDDRQYYFHYCNALSHPCCTIRELDLASNFVEDKQFIGLIQALRTNTRLESLNLRDNRITDSGMNHLVQMLPHLALKALNVSNNQYGRQVVMDLGDVMATQTSIRQLSVDHERYCPSIIFYLALNGNGRYCKSVSGVPLGLWPLILERCQYTLTSIEFSVGITEVDILFDLVHGPALLER